MAIDVESYRAEFPVLQQKAYLISASLGPVSSRARRYLQEYVDVWAEEGAPDPVWMEHIFPRMGQLTDTFGAMIGATRDELAITVNVSLALAAIMSCIDFSKRRRSSCPSWTSLRMATCRWHIADAAPRWCSSSRRTA